MVNKQVTNRKVGYDILRIIACFLVISNHTIGVYDQWGYITTFKWIVADIMFCLSKTAVPIFLLLSGALLLNKKEAHKDWIKRILHIIVLIACWAIIYKCESLINAPNKFSFLEACKILLQSVVDSIAILPSWHMWYLYVLLGIYLMLPFLRKMSQNMDKKDCIVFVVIWLIFSGFIPYYNSIFTGKEIVLNNNIWLGIFGSYITLYVMGYIITRITVSKKNVIIATIILIFSLMINVIVTYIKSQEAQMAVRIFDSALVMPVMITACSMLYIARALDNYIKFESGRISNILAEIGKCTLGVYLVHPIILRTMYANKLFMKYFGNYSMSLHQTIIVQLITFVISTIIVYIVRKIPIVKKLV